MTQPFTDVAADAAAEAGGLDPGLLGGYLDALAEAALRGGRLDEGALAKARAAGGHAAERGVPFRALADLFLSATWRAWRVLPAVRNAPDPTTMHGVGEAVLRAADDAVAAAADGYDSARRRAIRREEAARREFVDDLLGGTGDAATLLVRAEQFGIDLAGAHQALIVVADHPFRDATPTLARVEHAVAEAVGGGALITSKDGQLVALLPAGSAAKVDRAVRAVRDGVRRGLGGDAQWSAGVGRTYLGLAGARRSLAEARETLALTQRLAGASGPGGAGDTTYAKDLLIYWVLLRDREAADDLIESVLGPLREGRGGARVLLDTIATYVAKGSNSAATARALHISVRAVTYRLDRIRLLTGHDPTDPHDRYVLHTAALIARLLDWPTPTR